MRRTLGIVVITACLASCSDEEFPVEAAEAAAVAFSYPKAVPDSVIVAVGEVASINVKANDEGTLPDDPIDVLSNPIVGLAWKEDSLIRYAAPETPGTDTFSYELSVNGIRSAATVQVTIISDDDPALLDMAGDVRILRQAAPFQQLERLPYVPVDGARTDVQALVPLAHQILAVYGNPVTNLDRARAIRDWVARTAVHPYQPLHPDGSTANLAVLPIGASWRDVNNVAASSEKFWSDSQYWYQVHFNGYAMLNRLLGTLDPLSGDRADDGLMERIGPAHYRIRNIEEYRYVLCSYQDAIVIALWGAIGLQGMLVSTIGHDPAAVFIPELEKWVYQDPTYNEEFVLLDGSEVLSPLALFSLSLSGKFGEAVPQKQVGPMWSPDIYIDERLDPRATYFGDGHRDGMIVMGTQLNNGSPYYSPRFRSHLVQIETPYLENVWPFSNERSYARVTPAMAFPQIGARIASISVDTQYMSVHLQTTYPGHESFERRIGSAPWEPVSSPDILLRSDLNSKGSRLMYRSVDRAGSPGMAVELLAYPADDLTQERR